MGKNEKVSGRKDFILDEKKILIIIIWVLFAVAILSFLIQWYAEKDAFIMPFGRQDSTRGKEFEVYKLAAEVRQIRSDTEGSLFWLKLVAIFITVGGAMGGYLVAQSASTRKKIRFELRKSEDDAYQKIIQELSAQEPILRAASAVKLGGYLQSIPDELVASEDDLRASERRKELVQLTKQILAAALAIEKNEKVLKTITIALARKPNDLPGKTPVDLKELDLSWANAQEAYWARIDFSGADFFRANLAHASFRAAVLTFTQFYQTNLCNAVLSKATCTGTNFKFADLRGADFTGAELDNDTNFEQAKVYGIKLDSAEAGKSKKVIVDVSPAGDGTQLKILQDWLTTGNV